MRRYRVSRGVERSLMIKGLSGIWIMAFILGQMLLILCSVLCLLVGVHAIWTILLLTMLMASWTLLCLKMSRKYPNGSLERLMGLRMMPRCLVHRRRLGPDLTEEETASVISGNRLSVS